MDMRALRNELQEWFPYWTYLFQVDPHTESVYGIISPEKIPLSAELELCFIQTQQDFFWQQAYLWLLYSRHGHHDRIHILFQSLIESDPDNPFVLLRYARFL
jgi:hypothetical protein